MNKYYLWCHGCEVVGQGEEFNTMTLFLNVLAAFGIETYAPWLCESLFFFSTRCWCCGNDPKQHIYIYTWLLLWNIAAMCYSLIQWMVRSLHALMDADNPNRWNLKTCAKINLPLLVELMDNTRLPNFEKSSISFHILSLFLLKSMTSYMVVIRW